MRQTGGTPKRATRLLHAGRMHEEAGEVLQVGCFRRREAELPHTDRLCSRAAKKWPQVGTQYTATGQPQEVCKRGGAAKLLKAGWKASLTDGA